MDAPWQSGGVKRAKKEAKRHQTSQTVGMGGPGPNRGDLDSQRGLLGLQMSQNNLKSACTKTKGHTGELDLEREVKGSQKEQSSSQNPMGWGCRGVAPARRLSWAQ